ncbi:RnfABCDGE type electron transport complex subunit B [Methylomonas rapida]|uniref:RnfABCDGE type electron transport complex subunit B n=1 Tax=Methylomonas rapida TaxID=2963939 RepID=A0ABY7GFU8_9GAMM|nr:RnfABCDGE type electron transport complex subunit B [Methylomonas rapida]WAR44145.1 RnfABCDGE type electron transport complex subunit B [Methylomonas rapida]
MSLTLAERIDALLPQTQCRKCGFEGCKPYAEAMAQGAADINHCPPGGQAGIAKLADLLGVAAKPLDPSCGTEGPRLVAVINEADCIGCTKCLPPCPTDAILGASKHMHTVIAALCTGCELCVAPCPVACISMIPAQANEWTSEDAERSRRRYQLKNQRLARQEAEKVERLAKQKQLLAKLKTKTQL